MFCIVRADCDNEDRSPQPSYAFLRITPRVLNWAEGRMRALKELRKEDPFFLKAHFYEDDAVIAWFELWNDEDHDEMYLMIEAHDFDKEPIMVVPDSFDLPATALIEGEMDTMLVYVDEFSFRSMLGNDVIYAVPMFDPAYLRKYFDEPCIQKEAA